VGTSWGGDGSVPVGVAIDGSFAGGLGGVAERGERRGRVGLTPPTSGDGRRGEIIDDESKFPPPLISRSGGGREEEEDTTSVGFLSLALSGSLPRGSDTPRPLVKLSPEISVKGRTTLVKETSLLLATRFVESFGDI
jgi:hypothetical protein